MSAPGGRTCGECLFYEPVNSEKNGKCHRFPPAPGGPPNDHAVVTPSNWCGEYRSDR